MINVNKKLYLCIVGTLIILQFHLYSQTNEISSLSRRCKIVRNISSKKNDIRYFKELVAQMDNIRIQDIEYIKYTTTRIIRNKGKLLFYEVKLKSANLPATYRPFCGYLILPQNVDSQNNFAFFLSINKILFIKSKEKQNEWTVSGYYIGRGEGGTLTVFDFLNNNIYETLNTDLVYLTGKEACTRYKNKYLNFQNVDINKDGYLDLQFFGTKYNYCLDGEEDNYKHRKSLTKEYVVLEYLFDPQLHNWVKK